MGDDNRRAGGLEIPVYYHVVVRAEEEDHRERCRRQAKIRGQDGTGPFSLVIPIDLSAAAARPLLAKFWAAERVRDWEAVAVTGRRAERLEERIVELAVRYGLMSRYTSFLVVEHRTGARRASGQPETRVIPVNLPAGWAMFAATRAPQRRRFALASCLLPESAPVSDSLSLAAPAAEGSGLRRRVLGRLSKGLSVKSVARPKVQAQAQEHGNAVVALLTGC